MAPGRRLICWAGGAIAGLCCAAALAPVAHGAMTYSASGPAALTLPGVQSVYASLTFENTGAATESVIVGTSPGQRTQWFGAALDPEGFPNLQNLTGTTTITSRGTIVAGFAPGVCLAVAGNGVYGNPSYDVEMSVPAGAKGVLTQSLRVGDFPARPGDSFAVGFDIRDSGGRQLVTAPEPAVSGPSGINFAISPVVQGNRLIVSGATDPLVAGQVVQVTLSEGTNPTPVALSLGPATTDSQGHFSLSTDLPSKDGYYRVGATYISQSPSLASDTACGTSVYLPGQSKAQKKKGKKKKKKRQKRKRKRGKPGQKR